VDVTWAVDCSDGETFLYAYITNISALGIFIASRTPPAQDTRVTLRFSPPGEEPFDLVGEVAWINPWRAEGENINPGFGVCFTELTAEQRERMVTLVNTIAYLPG
jgi:type IV pilus assembly protein PilZ